MSFETECESCGAPSGPSVGVCPYCKTPFSSQVPDNPAVADLHQLYESGKLKEAVSMASMMAKEEKYLADASFLVLYGKILIEVEGPSGIVKSCFAKAATLDPKFSEESKLYVSMMAARSLFRKGLSDPGELRFLELLKEHPHNPHLLFLLAAHTFWVDRETQNSVRLLEQCVQVRPNFARAWGCLFAIYKFLKDKSNMQRCSQEFLRLEDNEEMKKFIQTQIEK